MKERYPELRWRVIASTFGVAFLLVFLRLGWVQVVRADHWQTRAELSSTETREIPARRGRLLDRRGQVLARTEIYANVGVARPHEWLRSEYPPRVAELLGISEDELRNRLKGRETHTVLVKDQLIDASTRNALASIPNMSVDLRGRRVRPHDRLARHLLGNVSDAGEGVTGLERIFDEALSGTAGQALVRQDAHEGVRSRRNLIEPVDGAEVLTTIDLRIQSVLEHELAVACDSAEANAAQGIVLHAGTGEVLALAQAPFRTPAPDGATNVDRWRVMAASDEFEPGSVFKLFALATLLSEGVVDTSTVFDGTGKPGDYRVTATFPNGRKIRDVHPVGAVSMRHAFVVSSNIIFAKAVEERLRTAEFNDAIRRFGFTERPGCGFRAETDGSLLPREQWTSYMMQSLAMGQAISVNLLQLASSTAAVLGDGSLRTPIFAREVRQPDGSVQELKAVVRRRSVVSPRVTAKLRAVTREVVHSEYGTATSAAVEGLSVAGKTGTAQISTQNGYVDGIYTPTFVGAIPAEDPRLIVIIVLHGAPGERTYGGNTAAPCFANVVRGIAARTQWLEGAFRVAQVEPAETIPAPALVGRTVEEVVGLASGSAWEIDIPDLPGHARAVSQMPAAGSPMVPGAQIQMAWSGGRR